MNISNRMRVGLLGILIAGALMVSGCATSGRGAGKAAKTVETPPAAAQEEKPLSARVSIESVDVVGDGDRVLIGTTGAIKYTVFKLTDPSRLIVDMPGVDLEKVKPSTSVDNDFIKDITVASYGGENNIGRITIGVKEGIDHDVKTGDKNILVSLKKIAVEETSAETASAMPPALAEAATAPDAQPIAATEAPEPQAEVRALPAKLATKILKVETSKEGGNTVVRIVTDGIIGNYNSFVLGSPSRVVIDVWNVSPPGGKTVINVNDKNIKTVRVGGHKDKSRLVFDSPSKKTPAYSVKRDIDTIVLTIGANVEKTGEESYKAAKNGEPAAAAPIMEGKAAVKEEPLAKEAVASKEAAPANAEVKEESKAAAEGAAPESKDASAPAAPAPAEAVTAAPSVPAPEAATPAAPADAPATNAETVTAEAPKAAEETVPKVESVEFKKAGPAGRLTVVTSRKAEYTVNEAADGLSVIVDIKGATIPDELVRTLDAAKLATPVASVSSYQESVEPKDVRVLVMLKEKSLWSVKDENGLVSVEFRKVPAPAVTAKAAEAATEAKAEAKAEEKIVIDVVDKKKEYTGSRIDLDMMDANISDVLRLLAEISNLNIIASDDVKGVISLRLKNIPWDQAFDIILKSKDLDMIKEGNVVRVAPALRIRQEKEAALASKKAQEKLEPLVIEFVPINYATAADLIKQVQGALTERGTATGDVRTNTLILKDVKSGIAAARNLIAKLDTSIPQVLIEARIVEASSSFARDLGIQWGVDYTSSGASTTTNTFGATDQAGQTFTSGSTSTSGVNNYAVNLPASGSAGTLGALGFLLGKAGTNPFLLDLRLSAGESEGLAKIISRPRVTTMDNKEAKIEQGESIPFETTSASGTATTFIDANLSLTVTPHITPDGSVLMKIKASKNSIGTFRTSSGEPSIDKKESATEVLVRDGETTVIGGIVVTNKSETYQGIPYLKEVPLLGWLFKSKSVSDSQTELLIFITPTIMKSTEKITG